MEKLVEKTSVLINKWREDIFKRVRDHLNTQYPPEKNNSIQLDSQVVDTLKKQLTIEISNEIKNAILADIEKEKNALHNDIENKYNDKIREIILQELATYPYLVNEKKQEVIATTPIEEQVASEASSEETNEPTSTPETERLDYTALLAALKKLTIIKDTHELEAHFSDVSSNKELAALIIKHVKHSHAPKFYQQLADILAQHTQGLIRMHIPIVNDYYQRLYQENTTTDSIDNKGIITKLIRPAILVNKEVVSKALVQVSK